MLGRRGRLRPNLCLAGDDVFLCETFFEEMEKDLWHLLEFIFHQAFLLLQRALDSLHEPSMSFTNRLVDEFEALLPSQAGRIARHPADFFVFVPYMIILFATWCFIVLQLWTAFRRLWRKVRCRRKRNNEPLLYRQEVPVAQGFSHPSPGRARPAWLPTDHRQLEDLGQEKATLTRRDRQPVCCFDLLGAF